MWERSFNSVTESLLAPFKKRLSGAAGDVRELVALVDFHLRILYTLSIADSRSNGIASIKVIGTPGFGTMAAVVRQAAKESKEVTKSAWSERIRLSAAESLNEIDSFKLAKRYKSFKTMRDQLSHGHALPSDDALVQEIIQSLTTITGNLQVILSKNFADCSFEWKENYLRIFATSQKDSLDVDGLWQYVEQSDTAAIYSHSSQDSIFYIAVGGEILSESESGRIGRFQTQLLVEKKNTNGDLGRLVKEILRDVSAFTEDYSAPSFFFGDEFDAGHLYVPWTRSTSDGNQARIDAFRIGPDNRREWKVPKSDDRWVSYSEFMREIANWPILARRIGIGLESFSKSRRDEELSRLGITQNSKHRGPSKLREVNEDLNSQEQSNGHSFDLKERVDDACERMKPSTAVYFVVGQAGLGKTDLMLSMAKNRAEEIAVNPDLKKPLFLFVSSTGRTLASLEDAVNGSLNITKLLSSHGAKALCRNGLLVLLVDGFDELLGSSGYQNALGSLEPWFKELGGRGVLVASARSSYYLTQYRRSLAETKDLNVDHTLVELQPWSRADTQDYLTVGGVPTTSLSRLDDKEWRILSIPFFSKAFVAWFEKNAEKGVPPSIFDIVVDQYLEREAIKLDDPHQGSLLAREELQSLFAEIAEMMQLGKVREIEQDDLISCAQQTIGANSLESVRPGLSRRLSSLCGLGVDSEGGKPNQFGFSHEVLFDCFLSAALSRNVVYDVSATYFDNILNKSKINTSVFEWIFQRNLEAISKISKKINFSITRKNESDIFAENLGSLWITMLQRGGNIPPTERVEGVRLGNLSLANVGWKNLVIKRSSIKRLEIPESGDFLVELSQVDIDILFCASAVQLKKVVTGLDKSEIRCIHIEDKFEDNPVRVRKALSDFGLVPNSETNAPSELYEAAEFFLTKIIARPDIQIVVNRDDWLTDDHRLSWTHRMGNDVWMDFLTYLLEYKLARWEQRATAGKAKNRLVFNVPVTSILRKETVPPDIRNFWDFCQKGL